jgi:SAM-dependent methyltransferase
MRREKHLSRVEVHVRGPDVQVPRRHYAWRRYNDQRRWASYWHQIDRVLALAPRDCLVIGEGDGTVTRALSAAGLHVVSVDHSPELDPDIIGDVRALPLDDASFDVVLCAQVLEHIPFHDVAAALGELGRVSRRWVVISLPQRGRSWEFAFRLSPLPRVHVGGKLPARTRHRWDGQHHWELGARDYPRRRVESILAERFAIRRTFLAPENPYHRFYVLEKERRS